MDIQTVTHMPLYRPRPSKLGNALVFLLAAASFFEVTIVGRLFVVELVFFLIAFFVILIHFTRAIDSSLVRKVLLLGFIWLIAQMASDIYRGTLFEDYARGWAKILFFCSNIVAIYVLVNNSERRAILFLSGLAVSDILGTIWFPSLYYVGGSVWKFGYAMPLTILLILLSLLFAWRFVPVMMLVALSAVNLFLDFRSLGGFCMLAAAATAYAAIYPPGEQQSRGILRHNRILKFVLASLAVVSLLYVLIVAYRAAGEMYIGIDVGQRQFTSVEERNPLYGRLGTLAGLRAALDSPIIGHGSWAKDPNYVSLASDMMRDVGLSGYYAEDLIPTHSYVIGSWVEAGIAGLAFWLFVLYHAGKAFLQVVKINRRTLPIFAFVLTSFIWAILFSPFGASARITAAYAIVLIAQIARLEGPERV